MDPFLSDLCLFGIYLLVTAIYQAVVSFVEVVPGRRGSATP